MSKAKTIKFADVVTMVNSAPSGGFVGITDYVSEKGEVSSVVGHLGFDYSKARQAAIKDLAAAVAAGTFEAITVKGKCYHDGNEFNARMRSCPVKDYDITYTPRQVLETANDILTQWQNPKERESNKVNLSDKQNGLVYNTESGNFTFALLVEKQTYKADKSDAAKEALGLADVVEIKAPETKLKEVIRGMFEKKMRSFTLSAGKFAEISIAGNRFKSDEITF